jgi:antitoxin component of MazEF toxin-antitoxin module
MVKVTKRGNSLGVNIHPIILKSVGIVENDDVLVTVKGKKIIIEKVGN